MSTNWKNSDGVGKDFMGLPDPDSVKLKIDVRTTAPDESVLDGTSCPDDVATVLNAIEPGCDQGWLIPPAGEDQPSSLLSTFERYDSIWRTVALREKRRKSFFFFGVPRSPETLEGLADVPATAAADKGLDELAEHLWFTDRDSRSSFRHSFD